MSGAPGLAAITFNADGGGVAGVARLIRQVLRDEWGEGVPLFELVPSAGPADTLASRTARLRFGIELASAEASGRVGWLVHSHLAVARVQRYIPARLGCRYAVFLHGIEAWDRVTPADRAVLDGATVLLSNSAHTARRVAAANPGLDDITVCQLGFSAPAEWAIPTTSARPIILAVARMVSTERYKGHDELIDALPLIRQTVPGATLVFVGSGDDVPRLRDKARTRGVGEHVTFTGFLAPDELRRAYADAAIFAMPSRGEGFGLAYLEAMAMGLACVGSVHDAASEVIEDGVTGVLVRQDDIGEIAGRISALLVDPERRVEMGRQGRARWEREFTYAHFRRRLMAALDVPFRLHGAATAQPSVAR